MALHAGLPVRLDLVSCLATAIIKGLGDMTPGSLAAPPVVRKLHVAMALYGDLTHDSRVIREAHSLAAEGHTVTIACLDASPATIARLPAGARVVVERVSGNGNAADDTSPFLVRGSSRVRAPVQRAMWLLRYGTSLARWGRRVSEVVGPVDVWHAHDLTGLQAVAPTVPRDIPIVYDSHELFLETGTAARLPRLVRRLLRAREARLVARCAAVVTVNPGLATVLEQRYHPARIEVVRNCPPRWFPRPTRPNLLRGKLGLAEDAPIVLFHGSLQPNRGIEQLMSALTAPGLEDLHLVLLGFGDIGVDLEVRAADVRLAGRLHVLAAVSPAELPAWVASADIGAVLQQPVNLNLVLSTPNKLYEAIAVGTPVLASDLPEIARIVGREPETALGVLCDPIDDEAIATALRWLLDPPRTRLVEMRARCLQAAESNLNWEIEAGNLTALYSDLAGSSL